MNFILEIGTEELPLQDMKNSLRQLPSLAEKMLTGNEIPFKKILSFATPRRIVLFIKGITERQRDKLIEKSGPPRDISFDQDGKPTKAAQGFARSQKVKVSQLVIKRLGKKEVICAVRKEKGRQTSSILKKRLPELISSLSFKQPMRWGETELSFSRPIRWFLALLDEKTIKFKIEKLNSSNLTYGHYFLSPGPFPVKNPVDYFNTLQKNFVILEPELRIAIIEKELEKLTPPHPTPPPQVGRERERGIKFNQNLIAEAGNLVEYPALLLCTMEKKYLKILPGKVIESAIKRLKGIPLRDERENLLPSFVIITNGTKNERIKNSYEKVLRAKLADGEFFYREDLKKPFAEYGDDIKKIIFHNQLGTTFDKVQRIEKLATKIGRDLDLKEIESLKRGALLCKNDLATRMVREFPELQGFIGGCYSSLSGENKLTSLIVEEHYLPRFPGDALPAKKETIAVGIADRLITICGYFIVGIDLSGSSDPYGIRRLANGFIELIWKKQLKLNLHNLLEKTVALFPSAPALTYQNLVDFFRQRLNLLLAMTGIPADIRAAVLIDFNDLDAIRKKSEAIKRWKKTPSSSASLMAFSRVANILKQAKKRVIESVPFKEKLLKEEAEKKLFSHYQNCSSRAYSRAAKQALQLQSDYFSMLKKFEELKPSIDYFFDNILVMDKNVTLRNNRLALLSLINREFLKLADFSKIEITDEKK